MLKVLYLLKRYINLLATTSFILDYFSKEILCGCMFLLLLVILYREALLIESSLVMYSYNK
jgi:hypothetical protein